MEPFEVAGEVFGGDAPVRAQEGFQPFMPAVDGLDVQFASGALAARLVERGVGDSQVGGAERISGCAIGDQQVVLAQNRLQDGLDGLGCDGG